MTTPEVKTFSESAKSFSRSPLGIIALFIVLVDAISALVLGIGAEHIQGLDRSALVWFLVLFPCVVLGVFAWLVSQHHTKLYGPNDFANQEHFLLLQKKIDILAEISPVAINFQPEVKREADKSKPEKSSARDDDDPQKGRWGEREDKVHHRLVYAGKIRPLKSDPDYFRIPIEVTSTDPKNHPLKGKVKFHLHDSFDPDIEEVEVRNGVARLELVAFGAFTIGVETDDGAKLEIDLADDSIDAPKSFKNC